MISKTLVANGIKVIQQFWKCNKWGECMADDSVPIQKKFLLNGIRFLYSSYITQQLETIMNQNGQNDVIKVIPTGSTNVGSDIDTQIMVNISTFSAITAVKRQAIIKNIIKILREGAAMWHVESIAESLDINLYPASILNYTTETAPPIPWVYHNRKTNMVCFKPQLGSDTLRREFIRMDYLNTRKHPTPNMLHYYEVYSQNITPVLFELVSPESKEAARINELIFKLVEFNEFADEVYFSVSAIIIVVWHMQMGNKIRSKKDMSTLCVCAFVENYNMFKASKKNKYKERYEYALKHILPAEPVESLHRTHRTLVQKCFESAE